MPRRTATISPSDQEFEKETNLSEHENNEEANGTLTLNDLKSLIYLGRLTKKVKISGFSFEISTLTTSQQRDIMVDIMSDGDAAQRMLDVKPLTMSYAVTSINGVPLEELCDKKEAKTLQAKREHVIYSLQSTLLEKLYSEYEALVERSAKEVSAEDLKG